MNETDNPRLDLTAVTYRGTVYPWQCDHMGHMNVMWYVGKFDEAVWNLFARVGLTPAYLRESGRGMAALEQRIQYRRELLAGDVVAVNSVVTEVREKVVLMRQTLFDADRGHVAARMDLVGAHLDTGARRAVPFPPEIAERLRAELAVPHLRPSP
jgi:acyl-CoA thioester hydrolase